MTSCLFCKIVAGKIPASVVYETDTVFAFNDIQPQAPTHVLVIPKQHVDSVASVSNSEILGDVFVAATHIATQAGLDASGYRLVTNHGADGGQSVPHFHVHVLGGRSLSWPPG